MRKDFLNNKGFAISGMLYTLFALFLIIMFSILAMSNFKRNVLIKTTENLRESYTLKEVSIDRVFKNDETRVINISGKYIFETRILGVDKICTAYLKKGVKIPENITSGSYYENFSLIPEDCNEYNSTIFLDDTETVEVNKMVLKSVYVFKKNEKESD